MPHILILSTLYPNRAQPHFGIFIEHQVRGLALRPRHRVKVVNPIGLPPFPMSLHPRYAALRKLPKYEIRNGIETYRPRFPLVPGLSGKWNPKVIATAIAPLVRKLHAADPFDLIDAEFFYPDGPAAMELAQQLRLPFSVKARGADIHHWGAPPGCRELMVQAARKAGGLLAVSAALKADMIALGMPGEKIRVHYTGVNGAHFKPHNRRRAKAALDIFGPMVLCVGALIPRKGQEFLIRALALLPEVTLVLAGEGPEEARYRALADDLGVASRIRWLGAVAHAALPGLYSAADVMAMPSSSEGLANAWVEALSCGTPIAICDVGGARELLKKPAAGTLVTREPRDIAEAIGNIVSFPPGQQAVRATVKHLSWKRNTDELVEHFGEILGSGR